MSSTRRTPLPTWLLVALYVTFIITATVVTVFVVLTAEAALDVVQRPFNPLENPTVAAVADTPLPPLDQDGPVSIATLPPGEPTPTPMPTAERDISDERVNILLMGIDRRPGQAFVSRTDTMMVISINTENDTVSILSVPRDLYVVIPGRGRDRINTAMVYGSAGGNPAAGAELAMQTVEYNLGVPIDHYFMLDFNAFIRAVDTLGGIDVNVPYDINDPKFPDMHSSGYDPLYIPAGHHHFDGEMALKYARTRHQDNDFYRAQRQQQVLMATRSKLLSLGPAQLIRQIPSLYRQFESGIRTDMSIERMIMLAYAAQDIPGENIRSAVLDHNYLMFHRTPQGASVLILINDRAAPLIQEMFFEN
ncbi:MAG: LCP family protein [Candidatus Promineifilaceae bacterium]|nr:LCP family protein [Candidatus Promineifilaceae bacterium]